MVVCLCSLPLLLQDFQGASMVVSCASMVLPGIPWDFHGGGHGVSMLNRGASMVVYAVP